MTAWRRFKAAPSDAGLHSIAKKLLTGKIKTILFGQY
jgi:hypothetical protein